MDQPRDEPDSSDWEERTSDKARYDRRMQLVVSGGFLLILAACGGAFWWVTHDRAPKDGPTTTASDPEAVRRQQQKEADDREAARQETERAALAAFVGPWVQPLAESPLADDPRTLRRRDKVLVFDLTTQAAGTAAARLPEALRGQKTDADLTLAIVLARRNTQVASYELAPGLNLGKPVPGYRVEMDVGLVDLVEKKALGRVTLTGDDPPETIKRKSVGIAVTDETPEYGDSDGPLARWLEARPRVGRPDRIAEARRLMPECRTRGKAAPPFPGKVLVWDVAKDVPSAANAHLPEALRGTTDDPDLTIVLVAERDSVPQTLDEALFNELMKKEKDQKKGTEAAVTAFTNGSKVYRERLSLCVVAFPGGVRGTAAVDGALLVEPPQQDRWLRFHTVGDSDKELARWIAGTAGGDRP